MADMNCNIVIIICSLTLNLCADDISALSNVHKPKINCKGKEQSCPDGDFCDPGYNYCMPCSLICIGSMKHEGECRSKCPAYFNSGPDALPLVGEGASSTKITTLPTRSAVVDVRNTLPSIAPQMAPDQSYQSQYLLQYMLIISLTIICVIITVSLIVYLIRRQRQNKRGMKSFDEKEVNLLKNSSDKYDYMQGRPDIVSSKGRDGEMTGHLIKEK